MRLVAIINVINGFSLSLCMPSIVNVLFTVRGHGSVRLARVAFWVTSKIKGTLQTHPRSPRRPVVTYRTWSRRRILHAEAFSDQHLQLFSCSLQITCQSWCLQAVSSTGHTGVFGHPVVTPWGLFLLVLVDLLLSCVLISVSWYVTNALPIVPRQTANLLAMVPKDTPPRSNCTTQLPNYPTTFFSTS